MSVKLDRESCSGCGICVEICLGDCLRLDGNRRPFIEYETECWTCGACEYECPEKAITATIDWILV